MVPSRDTVRAHGEKVDCNRSDHDGVCHTVWGQQCRPTLEACGEARADTLFYIQRDFDYNREVSPCEMTE